MQPDRRAQVHGGGMLCGWQLQGAPDSGRATERRAKPSASGPFLVLAPWALGVPSALPWTSSFSSLSYLTQPPY